MRTDDLIAALARDPRPALPPTRSLLGRALLIGAPLSLVGLLGTLGIREDAWEAMAEGWFALKLLLAVLITLAAWHVARAAAAPGATWPRRLPTLALLALALAVAADLAINGSAGWSERLVGDNPLQCLVVLPLLALPVLAALLIALRDAAPPSPALAGSAAGLLAGGVAAAVYGLHCIDDSPLFMGTWYVAAIAITCLAGAAIGQRLLKW
jgi:hypothetical protein